MNTVQRPQTSLESLLNLVMQNGWSYAMWREPGSDETYLMACEHSEICEPTITSDVPGFLIHSFNGDKPVRLNAEFLIKRFTDGSFKILIQPSAFSKQEHARQATIPEIASKDKYVEDVTRLIKLITEGVASKVVYSRVKELPAPEHGPFHTFNQLERTYPNAFVCLCWTPETGLWMGATPELLVAWDEKRWFRTVAVAGTRRLPESGRAQDTSWTQKEIEEQAFVTRDVIEKFKSIRLREFDEEGPKSVAAGPVVHLKTNFTVDAVATERLQLADEMLALLHPTSAVCGTPRENARELIEQLEPHDRELYAGYWGPVNVEGNSRMYVNLRTMKWVENMVYLFVGGGITAGSNPESEFEETESKAETLQKVLNGNT